DPDASRLGSALRIPPRGPEVEAVAHRRNSQSERLRPLDRERHGLLPRELAQCMTGIQHHRGLPIGNHGTRCFGRDRPVANPVEIHVHEHDPVRRHALEVGLDKPCSNASKASSRPGYGATKIMVRRDHVDSGRYKELKDLKGMKFAMNAPGVSNTSTLNTLLASAGLKYSDVYTVDLPLPDHVAALKNKSVDASASVEPAPALAIRNGDAVLIKSDDEILPNHQIAVLLYSEEFALRQTDAAKRFMRAYIRAVRFYNDALANGHLEGPTADEVIAILSEATPIRERAIYKLITPTGMNPDGHVNRESLAYDLAFYAQHGLIKGKVELDQV